MHTVGPPRPLIPSCGSNIPDFMDVKLWDTEGRLYVEKNPCVTGPLQFKPMLFRVNCVHTVPFCPSRTFPDKNSLSILKEIVQAREQPVVLNLRECSL